MTEPTQPTLDLQILSDHQLIGLRNLVREFLRSAERGDDATSAAREALVAIDQECVRRIARRAATTPPDPHPGIRDYISFWLARWRGRSRR